MMRGGNLFGGFLWEIMLIMRYYAKGYKSFCISEATHLIT
jgi:hypothetical protein